MERVQLLFPTKRVFILFVLNTLHSIRMIHPPSPFKKPVIILKPQEYIHITISRTLQLVESCENLSLATICWWVSCTFPFQLSANKTEIYYTCIRYITRKTIIIIYCSESEKCSALYPGNLLNMRATRVVQRA